MTDPGHTSTSPLKVTGPFPESRQKPARHTLRNWGFGVLAVLILAGTLGYFFLNPAGEVLTFRGPEEVPPVLRTYLDKANQGDPMAMAMLGNMYYNGLNVRQNRREGIKWYRKAAAAGSVAARKDLEQLGLSLDGK